MKNPYVNTIWSERDQAFVWTGAQMGFAVGVFGILLVDLIVLDIWYAIKENKKKKNK